MSAIRLSNLTLGYDRHPAVHHITGSFEDGTLTAVTGPNGGGKSTLLKGIAGLLAPQEGRILLDGITPRDIAYLPQASEMQNDFPLSVLQMVTTGCWHQAGVFGALSKTLKSRAQEALNMVGLQGFANRPIGSLSAGQFQRALFARLLLQDAPVILLDEPFTAVDADTTAHLLKIIGKWHQEGRLVICVLHDMEQIRSYFPQCMILARHCLGWGKTSDMPGPEQWRSGAFQEAWHPQAEVCRQ